MAHIPRYQLVCVVFTLLMSTFYVSHAAREASKKNNLVLSHLLADAPGFAVAHPPWGKNTCPVALTDCGDACARRCSATSHTNNCLLFCNYCCQGCLCVPPGTFGNKECCDCYNNWKTKEGGPKCP